MPTFSRNKCVREVRNIAMQKTNNDEVMPMNAGAWKNFFTTCAAILGEGAPAAAKSNTWCSWTTFKRLRAANTTGHGARQTVSCGACREEESA
ncbi:hypothetical protein Q3P05_24915, partial [Ralstonia pseudosolanacearum]|nr:hypothetical protein [Ralstonia pseudosolanacearum]